MSDPIDPMPSESEAAGEKRQRALPSDPVYLSLAVLGDALEDIERTRIAAGNRYKALTHASLKNFNPESKYVVAQKALWGGLLALEKQTIKALEEEMKKCPLAGWVERTKGAGQKSVARVLALIYDPYWHPRFNRPRTVSELWAYCGLHVWNGDQLGVKAQPDDVSGEGGGAQGVVAAQTPSGIAPHRVSGLKSNWSTKAKTRLFVVAGGMVKSNSPLRVHYDTAKAKYAEAVHAHDCRRCKRKAGEPLRPAHIHARAMRALMKEILKQFWLEAKEARDGSAN